MFSQDLSFTIYLSEAQPNTQGIHILWLVLVIEESLVTLPPSIHISGLLSGVRRSLDDHRSSEYRHSHVRNELLLTGTLFRRL